ncbi:hypothetical protein ABEF95_004305 [Exophiala dermatitidis]
MAQAHRTYKKITFEGDRPRRTEQSGMLEAYLYSNQTVFDAVHFERGQHRSAATQQQGNLETDQNEQDSIDGLLETMDALTDAEIVRDAVALRNAS